MSHSGQSPYREVELVRSDLTVVGGGMAGLCAAIAAARLGLSVALVTDRPVLGGNSSSEIRVWVNGATGGKHNRYAREGGIMEEILLENKYRNPDGNAHLWDAILLDWVRAEPNLRLFLNTPITQVEAEGPEGARRVVAVAGHQLMSERSFRFESPLFVDASGDGVVAAAAGARYRIGREARSEFGETWAPEAPDRRTLGSSIMFYSKDAGRPVPFRPPAFARDFKTNPPTVLARRADPKDTRCCYWWIEWGGELDTIRDNERIRDELWAIVYGAWDYIKNSGRFAGVENLVLEWVGSIPGKRESRRFEGDYILTEHDVVEQRLFPDRVAHGGWSIDLHPPKGFYEDSGEASRHWHLPGPYSIPYRILYSRDVENLFLAGRLVSASHVAFGTLRVQMTLATMGQAVGTAASLCRRYGTTPRGVYQHHLAELQQLLLREDQWVIGVPNQDPADVARQARVTASSVHPLALLPPEDLAGAVAWPLEREAWLYLPVGHTLASVELLAEATAPTQLTAEVWTPLRPENYIPQRYLGTVTVAVPAGGPQWLSLPLPELAAASAEVAATGADRSIQAGGRPVQAAEAPAGRGGLVLVIKTRPELRLLAARDVITGVLAGEVFGSASDPTWRVSPLIPYFRVQPEQTVFGPQNVVNGYSRPYGGPNCWLSQPMVPGRPEWLQLDLGREVPLHYIQLTFNTNLTPWYNHLRPTDQEAVPQAMRDYTVWARTGGQWQPVVDVQGNYQRVRRHRVNVVADALRIEVKATNGAPRAEIFEVRAW